MLMFQNVQIVTILIVNINKYIKENIALQNVQIESEKLCFETDKELTQEEVDHADELAQIAFPDEWKEDEEITDS